MENVKRKIKLVVHIPETKPSLKGAVKIVIREKGGICLGCGTKKNLSIDHIIPISKGGHHGKDNLQVLCRPCNSIKGNKIIKIPSEEFSLLLAKAIAQRYWRKKYCKKDLTGV